jgi:hypothetical protein
MAESHLKFERRFPGANLGWWRELLFRHAILEDW